MLDTLYKTAVVSVTKRYAEGPPAIKVAMDVFGACMEKDGWHKAKARRRFGNAPKRRQPLRKRTSRSGPPKVMQSGPGVLRKKLDGAGEKRLLRVATIVPAVAKRLRSCHGVKEGDLLGFIRYGKSRSSELL